MNKKIQDWLKHDPDPNTRAEIEHLLTTKQTHILKERFDSRLQFGTAGLRGLVGAGPNRINQLVIRQTTLGLAHYLKKSIKDYQKKGVIIGFDGRHNSKDWAYDAAGVLCQQGIKTYLLTLMTPTPLIPFGIHQYKCAAGIMITASHNTSEFNGYKLYWDNGTQINTPHHTNIQQEIEKVSHQKIDILEYKKATEKKHLILLDQSFVQSYRQHIILHMKQTHTDKLEQDISIAYTAMHGVAVPLTQDLMHDLKVKNFYCVDSQCSPDGDFPTVKSPNPENPAAMKLVTELAQKHKTDLACAHDPDGDRFAVIIKKDDRYLQLNGDQIGILLADYLLSCSTNKSHAIGNTLVSSNMLESLAKSYNAEYFQTPTGFKWLAKKAQSFTTNKPFLFAYEEAIGFMFNNQIWDKDGLSAMAHFITMTKKLKNDGKTIWNQLEKLYRKHGLYIQKQIVISCEKKPNLMDDLRKNALSIENDHYPLKECIDLEQPIQSSEFPSMNVLIFYYTDIRVIVRPSGTEPKIKFYYEIKRLLDTNQNFKEEYRQVNTELEHFIYQHQKIF